ncbi:MAG: InlB B-repeat-containing protein [Clostridiales Family XIII bacterium]|jgi:uncharacterized repeat protein (TIGR02543 family)|nr:InlB B-repeat-containing protein [Clostridiales Family XIII bacterium]
MKKSQRTKGCFALCMALVLVLSMALVQSEALGGEAGVASSMGETAERSAVASAMDTIADSGNTAATDATLAPAAVAPAVAETEVRDGGVSTLAPAQNTYDAGDIAVINKIIADNGLSWDPIMDIEADTSIPSNWNSVEWSTESTGKRITKLSFSYTYSLEGTLDVSQLSELTWLDCYSNKLTGIEVGGLTKLEFLDCSGNKLASLDASGLTSLKKLHCSGNELVDLVLTGDTNLENLSCSNNFLEDLDVEGLANLKNLNCSENKLTALALNASASYQQIDVRNNWIANMTDVYGSGQPIGWGDGANYFFYPQHVYAVAVSGSNAVSSGSGNYTPGVTVTISAGSRTNYTFTGWTTSSNGVSFEDAASVTTAFTMPGNPVAVTANWSYTGGSGGGGSGGGSAVKPPSDGNVGALSRLSVTLNVNGGQALADNKVSVEAGGVYGALPTPKRKGHVFAGWYTEGADGVQVVSGAAVQVAGDHTLYAHWTANKYVLTFKVNKGKALKASLRRKAVTFDTRVGKLSVPKRSGYVFKGWYTKKSGGKRVVAATVYSLAKSQTLYAKWAKKGTVAAKKKKAKGIAVLRTAF